MALGLASQAAGIHICLQYSNFWLFIAEATGSDISKRFCLLLQWDMDSVCFVERRLCILSLKPCISWHCCVLSCTFINLLLCMCRDGLGLCKHACDTVSRCVWSYHSGHICVSLHKATWLCCHSTSTVLSVHIQYAQESLDIHIQYVSSICLTTFALPVFHITCISSSCVFVRVCVLRCSFEKFARFRCACVYMDKANLFTLFILFVNTFTKNKLWGMFVCNINVKRSAPIPKIRTWYLKLPMVPQWLRSILIHKLCKGWHLIWCISHIYKHPWLCIRSLQHVICWQMR